MGALASELLAMVDLARHEALARSFHERTPTPLRSDFWGTSLAPSSSEVLFREFAKRPPTEMDHLRLFTLQPCIRFADLGPSSDGTHLLHFHMFTCFAVPSRDPDTDVRWFLELLERLGAPISSSYFTYFAGASPVVPAPAFPDFGSALLDRMGIANARRVPCAGLANYQLHLHRDETGNTREAWGPRIEILAELGGGAVEYATLILSSTRLDPATDALPPTLSMVFGVERLAQVAGRLPTIWDLPTFQNLQRAVLGRFFPGSATLPLIPDVRHALDLVTALVVVAEAEPDLLPGGSGVRNQLRRIIQATGRQLAHIGIDATALLLEMEPCLPDVSWSDGCAQRVAGWLCPEAVSPRPRGA